MNANYVVMEIGCLECGEPSLLLGIFEDLAPARARAAERSRTHPGGGSARCAVFSSATGNEMPTSHASQHDESEPAC